MEKNRVSEEVQTVRTLTLKVLLLRNNKKGMIRSAK